MENSQRKYAVLSLDPMYSPLHSKIAVQVGKQQECYAILSCWAKKVYLRGFQCTLATKLINSVNESSLSNTLLKRVEQLTTYHHAYVKKVEKRALTQAEIRYMARFYQALEQYIDSKRIELILVHNDLRWYHAIAIDICKRKGIRYLVTEQGLIRPYTTVIDNQGVNANANIKLFKERSSLPTIKAHFKPNTRHDSWVSIIYFLFFIITFSFERLLGSRSILRYMHNNYSIKKYFIRFIYKFKSNKISDNDSIRNTKYALLILQLEYDSQILVHSDFYGNQEIIDKVEKQIKNAGMVLIIKKHPLDFNNYKISESTKWVSGNIKQLSSHSSLVITVNSSAVIDVLHTSTPLILLGDSIYNIDGVAEFSNINNISDTYKKIKIDREKRQRFIRMIKNDYLMQGAAFSYHREILNSKLIQLIEGE